MIVSEVTALFRFYTGEDDNTFMSPAQEQILLNQAYEEFRDFISACDPLAFVRSTDITVVNSNTYALDGANAVVLLGADAGLTEGARLKKIVQIALLNSDGDVIQILRGTTRIDGITPVVGYGIYSTGAFTEAEYALIGATLQFSLTLGSIPLRIYWEPESQVDWSVANSFVDDFTNWHDVIAQLAWRHYAAADNSMNPAIQSLLDHRMHELRMFLSNGRDDDAAQTVMIVQ